MLTAKQRAFVDHYLANGMSNAAAAYRAAYPTSLKWSAQRQSEEAQRLLGHPMIAPLIEESRLKVAAATASAVNRLAITKENWVKLLAGMATYDIRGAYQWEADGSVILRASTELPDDLAAAITAVETRADGSLKFTFADKRQAAMDVAKLMGWVEDKKSVRLIKRVEDLTDEELAALADSDRREGKSDGTRH